MDKGESSTAPSSQTDFYCSCCDVDLRSKNVYEQHIQGKKHKKNERVINEKHNAECTVFVSGIRSMDYIEILLKSYFHTFGKVAKISLGHGDFAFVRFDNVQSAKRALKETNHEYEGFHFRVKEFKYRDPQQEEEEKEKKAKEQLQWMRDMLKQKSRLSDQFYYLSHHLTLSNHDLNNRDSICNELARIFYPYFETCSVHQFGSSINGYGLKGCDLDLFLDFNKERGSLQRRKTVSPMPFKVRGIKNWTANKVPLSNDLMEKLADLDKVKFVCHILRLHSRLYKDILVVPAKRCPLVRFHHQYTGIKCDLSLNNRKALYNSRLLKLYSQDYRVQQLVTFIRYWGRVQRLTSSEGTSTLITSYALTWLVLYYLMRRKNRVIPRVDQLMSVLKGKGVHEETVDSFKCLDIALTAKLPPSQNKETVANLLYGFFEFYTSGVDWERQALSTWDGKVLLIDSLDQNPLYADCKTGYMTMFDPFVLSHNILANVNERTMVRFASEIKKALEIIKIWYNQATIPVSEFGYWGLSEFLIPSPLDPEVNKKTNKGQMRIKGEKNDGIFVISLHPTAEILNSEEFLSLSKKMYMTADDLWCCFVKKLVVNILETVYLVDLKEETVDECCVGEKDKTEMQDDGITDEKRGKIDEKKVEICNEMEIEVGITKNKDATEITDEESHVLEKVGIDEEREFDDESVIDENSFTEKENSSELSCDPEQSITSPSEHVVENPDEINIASDNVHDTQTLCSIEDKPEDERVDAPKSKRSAQIAEEFASKRFKQQSDSEKEIDDVVKEIDSSSTSTSVLSEEESNSIDANTGVVNEDKIVEKGSKVNEDKIVEKGSKVNEDKIIEKGSKVKKKISSTSSSKSLKTEKKMNVEDAYDSVKKEAVKRIVGNVSKVSNIWSYSCCSKHAVWVSRNQMKQSLSGFKNLNELTLEREITKKVIAKLDKLNSTNSAEKSLKSTTSAGSNSATNPKAETSVLNKELEKETKCNGDTIENRANELDEKLKKDTKKVEGNNSDHSNTSESNVNTTDKDLEKVAKVKDEADATKQKGNSEQPKAEASNKSSESPKKSSQILFSCKILELHVKATSVPHISIIMHASPDHLGAFRNLFASVDNVITRLVSSHLYGCGRGLVTFDL